MPAPGFKWNQTRQLNQQLHDRHANDPIQSVRRKLKLSHGRAIKLVAGLSDSEFLNAGHFEWTGGHALASYVAPNTFSHYRWAAKKIRKEYG